MLRSFVALACGLLFGVGLALSGMTDTRVVLGFLDIAGQWNPALLLVMSGALTVTLPAFRFALRRQRPLLCEQYDLPQKTVIDRPLLVGAALFGIGWGLYGYCPGPALASLSSLDLQPVVFVIAMAVGVIAAELRSAFR